MNYGEITEALGTTYEITPASPFPASTGRSRKVRSALAPDRGGLSLPAFRSKWQLSDHPRRWTSCNELSGVNKNFNVVTFQAEDDR